MTSHCKETAINFKSLCSRIVLADFDGGHVTSDACAILLEQVDRRLGLLERFAACFSEYRSAIHREHQVRDPTPTHVVLRVQGLC